MIMIGNDIIVNFMIEISDIPMMPSIFLSILSLLLAGLKFC